MDPIQILGLGHVCRILGEDSEFSIGRCGGEKAIGVVVKLLEPVKNPHGEMHRRVRDS